MIGFDHIAAQLLQAAILLAICASIEQVAVIDRYSLKQRIPGAIFQAVGIVLGGLLAWALQQVWAALGLRLAIVPLYSWLEPLPGGAALYFLAMFAIADLLTYWRHRAEHRWFWPIHAVHHSPHELHAANDIGHPLQVVPDLLLVWFPLSLVQMPGPKTPAAIGLIAAFVTIYIHSPIDFHFGPFRRVVVDNRFHRIHHSLDPRHIDHNFSVGLSCWDWLFGTAYWPAKDEWPAVGVAGLEPPRTVSDFLKMPQLIIWRRRADAGAVAAISVVPSDV